MGLRLSSCCLSLGLIVFAGCESNENPPVAVWLEESDPKQAEDTSSHTISVHEDSSALSESNEETPEAEELSDDYGIGVSLDGFRPFPENDPWNTPINALHFLQSPY